jgi:hypothetical protein
MVLPIRSEVLKTEPMKITKHDMAHHHFLPVQIATEMRTTKLTKGARENAFAYPLENQVNRQRLQDIQIINNHLTNLSNENLSVLKNIAEKLASNDHQ